jgi:Fe-S cluster assembly scaffold protein SufB
MARSKFHNQLVEDVRIKPEFRKEVSRKVSLANKRLARLEKNGLTDSPAYKKFMEGGAKRFSIRGKTGSELTKELIKINNFIEMKTSTIKGLNKVLKDTADRVGVKYKDIKQLQQYSSKFFELYNKSMQYLDTVENLGHAFDSTQVMETVRQVVKQEKVDLADSEAAIDEMIKRVSDMLTDIDNYDEELEGRDWYRLV